jgi:hypothetical protein
MIFINHKSQLGMINKNHVRAKRLHSFSNF